MAELTADTSSYPKAQLPVSPLDMAGKLGSLQQQNQQIQSGALTIDKQKLDLVSQHMAIANHELSILANDPDLSQKKVTDTLNRIAKTTNMPPEVYQKMHQEYEAAGNDPAKLKQTVDLNLRRGMSVAEQLANQYGTPGMIDNGQTSTPVQTSQQKGTVLPMSVAPAVKPALQHQIPPTAEGVDTARVLPTGAPNPNYGAKSFVGPQPSALPVAPPKTTGPTGPTVRRTDMEPTTFNDRFPSRVATSLPPGAGEAVALSAGAGAKAAAEGRHRAAMFNREVFPLNQAIPALEKLGPKGTGPGTETINHLKSFALSNIPGVKESDFNGTVADYDKAKKYLTDFVNQTGSSGTNDKLAAAFAGNPSVGISNAAAVDVAKSALALRRMQQAEDIAFEKSGLPDEDRQKFAIRFNQEQDPRAYGADVMGKDKLKKLIEGMSKTELATFKKSLEVAHDTKAMPPISSR